MTPAKGVRREGGRVVDPTSVLLRQITGVESHVPWIPLGIALLVLLWLPGLTKLTTDALRPAEQAWVQEVLEPGQGRGVSAFAKELAQATWAWQGAEIETAELTPPQRIAARVPSYATGLVAVLVFYFLARLVVGDAAALLSACLLATSAPWARAGTSAHPLIVGEMFVLFGVFWALTIQARHREVGVAPVNAMRVGGAGIFLGVGMLLAPSTVATFATTLVVWLMLGLRRSSSRATTLPVGHPGRITALVVLGLAGLFAAAAISMGLAERFLGGATGFPGLLRASSSPELWADVYDTLLSPGRNCNHLILAALAVIAAVRGIEWTAGRPWQAAGLLPWVFLGLWVFAYRADVGLGAGADRLELLTVPPLFVLGTGWLVLRGLRPGVVRRQEYTFLVVWVLVGTLLIPFVGSSLPDAATRAAVVALPPLLLVAGRGARALWESGDSALAKIAVFVIAYVPVLLFVVVAVDRVLVERVGWIVSLSNGLYRALPWIVLCGVGVGILSE
ncbi:hypothetical protein K8I85_02145, partial [bacterium]|nr:hypothetical protein [bacterium]